MESIYHVRRDAEGTAILGASMGGLESLIVGLDHPDRFGWVGGESSALKKPDFDAEIPSFKPATHPVWMVCGRQDELLESNRQLSAWLQKKSRQFSWKSRKVPTAISFGVRDSLNLPPASSDRPFRE